MNGIYFVLLHFILIKVVRGSSICGGAYDSSSQPSPAIRWKHLHQTTTTSSPMTVMHTMHEVHAHVTVSALGC